MREENRKVNKKKIIGVYCRISEYLSEKGENCFKHNFVFN